MAGADSICVQTLLKQRLLSSKKAVCVGFGFVELLLSLWLSKILAADVGESLFIVFVECLTDGGGCAIGADVLAIGIR